MDNLILGRAVNGRELAIGEGQQFDRPSDQKLNFSKIWNFFIDKVYK
jgi:hypothetical protein